ncbi:MAG: hypothetical protein ACE5JI_01205 [Acidobacteriota bacterium]
MPRHCRICAHPKAEAIDADLAAGYAVVGISVKHFGDRSMLEVLLYHQTHLRGVGSQTQDPEQTPGSSSPAGRRPERPISYEQAPVGALLACEPMRVKGVVYEAGEMIPEADWRPTALAAALKVGTVKRKGGEPPG